MQIQVRTDHNIEGGEGLTQFVESVITDALARFAAQITRVEVHLSDSNSNKKGGTNDQRCMLEARPAGHQPIAVTHEAETLEQAIDGAARKLVRSLESTLGRLGKR